MDASLGPGSAVRGNGKKRGEIAKKTKNKKQKKNFGERTHHFPFPDYHSPRSARLSFILRLFPPLRGRVPGYVDAHDGFWSLSEETLDGVTNRKSQSKGSVFPQLYHS